MLTAEIVQVKIALRKNPKAAPYDKIISKFACLETKSYENLFKRNTINLK